MIPNEIAKTDLANFRLIYWTLILASFGLGFLAAFLIFRVPT